MTRFIPPWKGIRGKVMAFRALDSVQIARGAAQFKGYQDVEVCRYTSINYPNVLLYEQSITETIRTSIQFKCKTLSALRNLFFLANMIRDINCIELRGDAKFITDKYRIKQSAWKKMKYHYPSIILFLNLTVFSTICRKYATNGSLFGIKGDRRRCIETR